MPPSAAKKASPSPVSLTPPATGSTPPISNDVELLAALGISEAQAAAYLGKTRQALHNGLLPDKQGKLPTNYFRCSDIFFLVSAKILEGVSFDAAGILVYVHATREDSDGQTKLKDMKDGRVLLELLKRQAGVDTATAFALVFVLPGFTQIQDQNRSAIVEMKRWVELLRLRSKDAPVLCLSESSTQVSAAGLALGIDDKACIADEVVQHYLPCVLAYELDRPVPRILVMTGSAGIVEAPGFRVNIITNCVEDLIKANPLRDLIRNRRKAFMDQDLTPA